ncbi:hypothetical protein J3E68DRAFT_450501 [Trichoderma sp. SZMC 28012]
MWCPGSTKRQSTSEVGPPGIHHNRGVSLTQICPTPDADASDETDVDIIAIHGLDAESPDTWVWKSKSPNQDTNWLASPRMLPGRIGPARIFLCDWPADLLEQPDLIQKTVEEFARLLLAGIKRRPLPKTRHTKEEGRPIVFIASCLGGIILMKALLIADHPPSEYTAIRQSTRGIVFLATPFRGTSFQDVANWAEPGLRAWASIRGQKVSNLIGSVKESTFYLEELVRGFTQLCQDKDYPCQVFTFYEMGKTRLYRKFPLSRLLPSWLLDLFFKPKPLVDSSSATLDIVTHPLPLDRKHVMMNKFKDPEDADYKCVSGIIEEILQHIRTNSLLADADAWIRNKHYTVDRLKIERLSGDLLPMDQCYINLALVEQRGQAIGRSSGGAITPSPFSLFDRQKVETPDRMIQVELAAIFNQRKGRDGNTIQPRRILIRGRAGAGKTTLCKKIVHEFMQGTWSEWNSLFDRILWVPLRNLKLEERCRQPGYNFEQLFTHEYFSLPNHKPAFSRELAQALELEAHNSKTLFLLDGLDEVSQDLGSGSMSSFLNELLRQPNIIVTSRPSGKLPPDLDLELETIGFYPDQVKEYIKKIFTDSKTAKTDGETVAKVQSFLEKHWLIQGLVRIPIQLDALCYSWKDIRSDMSETMTALYQAIELSLWKKDIPRLKKTHGQNLVSLDHIQGASRQKIEGFVKDEISFLESLAFTGLHNDVVEFELKHLNRISDPFRDFLPDKTIPCLSFLRTSNPFSGDRNRSYHFIHLTFQEYFAARYFARQWVAGKPLNCAEFAGRTIDEIEPIKFFQKHKYTARYDILWRFVAGLLDAGREEIPIYSEKLSDFFQIIEEEPLDLLGPTHQRLVMHCLSEVSNNLPIRATLERQLSRWLVFEYEFRQSPRAHLASEVEFPQQALDIAFREGSDDVRRTILRSVTKRATVPSSIIERAASWLEHQDMAFRHDAVWALGQRTALPNEILRTVAARLQDEDSSIRQDAIWILAQQSVLPDEILKSVETRLMDKNRSVREAAKTLHGGQQPAISNKFLDAIAARLEDKDWFVREAAVRALGQQSTLPDETLEAIAKRLEDKEWSVREVTKAVLSQYQRQVLPDEIPAPQFGDKNCSVQDIVDNIVGEDQQLASPEESLEAVAARLENEDEFIRQDAMGILAQQPALPIEILQAVTARLEDDNEFVRKAAETVIRRHGEFYSTLLKGTYVATLYKVLLQRSFEEQLSWYIVDGHSCINMPEDIRRTSIDKGDNIMDIIKSARPANFPSRVHIEKAGQPIGI